MAEAIFNKLCTMDNITASSAGLSVVKDSKTSKHSASLVNKYLNVDISDKYALQLTEGIIKESDLILTMTVYMRDILRNNFPNLSSKIYVLNEYVGVSGDVLDPYGGDIAIYTETFNSLKASIELLLYKLKGDKSTS
jgi:protein-tyrosine phosphatase